MALEVRLNLGVSTSLEALDIALNSLESYERRTIAPVGVLGPLERRECERLLAKLGDNDPWEIWTAVAILTQAKTKRGTREVIKIALDNARPVNQNAAVNVLTGRREKRCVGVLQRIALDVSYAPTLRVQSIYSLGLVANRAEVRAVLLRTLSDESPSIRHASLTVLAPYSSVPAIYGEVVSLIDDAECGATGKSIGHTARQALADFGPPSASLPTG